MKRASSQENVQEKKPKLSLEDIQEHLSEAFESLESAALSIQGQITVPRIKKIEGIDEPIPEFPWKVKFIKQLLSIAQQAPVGKDEKTVVDVETRNSFQIGAEHLDVGDGHLRELARLLTQDLCTGLNDDSLSFELHKMLIYQKGSFFKPHTDTPRGKNHIGTVVVVLPVKHAGGEIIVQDNSEYRVKYDLGSEKNRKNMAKVVAFYAQTVHEILPITQGYRIALTYHVFNKSDNPVQKPRVGKHHPLVQQIQKLAECSDFESRYIGFFLDNRYTPKKAQAKFLIGKDSRLYNVLAPVFKNVRVSPCDIKIEGFGSPDSSRYCSGDPFNDVEDPFVTVSEMEPFEKSFKSRPLFSTIEGDEIDNCNFIAQTPRDEFKKWRRVDLSISGSGNEGCDYHARYRGACILVGIHPDADFSDLPNFSQAHFQRADQYWGV